MGHSRLLVRIDAGAMSRRKQGNPQHLSQREIITRKCLRRAREGPERGAPAPRAGDTEPGTAGPGARAARGLAQGQRRRPRAWLGVKPRLSEPKLFV